MAGEIGRFTAVIGADHSGLSTAFAQSRREIQSFVKDAQAAFKSVGSGDFGAVGVKTGQQITEGIRRGLDVGPIGAEAGRLLASGLSTALTAETQTLRTLFGASLIPSDFTTKIQGAIASGLTPLPRQFQATGVESGRALVSGITGEIATGTRSLKALTAGATVVTADTSGIREATTAQKELLTVTTQTTEQFRQQSDAMRLLGSGAGGVKQAERSLGGLREAQQQWLKETQGASVAAQAVWQRQREAAFQAAQEVKRTASETMRGGQQEVAARAQVRAELAHEIQTLRTYGATVSGVNAEAVAAWRAEAAAIRKQAQEVGLARDQMLKLELVVQQTERAFTRQSAAAERATAAARGGASPRVGFNTTAADIAGLQRSATGAARSVGLLGRVTSAFTSQGSKAATTAIAIGFGMESLARGGDAAQSGVRSALRALASFTLFLGPEGQIVSGVALGTAAILDLFQKTRDGVEETRKKFVQEVGQMVQSADVTGLLKQLQTIELGTTTVDENLNVKTIRGLKELKAEAESVKAQLEALSGRRDLAAVQQFNRLKKQLRELQPDLTQRQSDFDKLAKAINNLPTIREITGSPAIVTATKDADGATKELLANVKSLVSAYQSAGDNAALQQAIIPRLVQGYDAILHRLGAQTDQASKLSTELRDQLATLKAFDPVIVGLARRQFGDVTKLPEVKVPAVFVDIKVPTNVKALVQKALTFRALPPIPIDIDPTFNADEISLAFKNALSAARLAKADLGLADAINDQKLFADATKRSAAASQQLRTIAAGLTKDIRANPLLSDTQKTFGINAINAALDGAITRSDTLGGKFDTVAQSARAFANVADEISGVDRTIGDAIDSVGRLANSIGALSDQSKALKASGKGGLFSSVENLVKSLPEIGDLAGAVIDAWKNVGEAVFHFKEREANNAILKQNNERLEQLRQDLAGFTQTPGQMIAAAKAITDNALLKARRATDGFSRGFRNVEDLDRQLRESGSSVAALKRRAEELGITIVDSKNRITAQGLDALNKALLLEAERLVRFGNSFADQTDAAALRRRVLGQQDDQQKIIDDSLRVFAQFAPNIASKFFTGIDTATKEGRAAFKAAILRFVNDFIAGTIPLGDFGELDKTTIISVVNTWLDGMDEMSEAAKTAAGSMVNVAEGVFNLNKRLSQVLGQSPTGFRDIIPPPPNPVPIPVPVGGDSGTAGITINVDVGTITAGAKEQTKEQIYQGIRRQAIDKAAAISPAAKAAVIAALPA